VLATILQVAVNDGNYYEMINGGQNLTGQLRGWRRWNTCLAVAAIAALVTWWFVHVENGFFRIAGYSAIALPCATVVMCVDQFVLPRLVKVNRPVQLIPEWRSAAVGNWPAIVAVLVSVFFGAWGQVLLPGQTSAPNLGLVPVEARIMAGVPYVLLAAVAARTPSARAILGFSRQLRQDGARAPASASETAV
jgi:purine-cytosine permease-like protein